MASIFIVVPALLGVVCSVCAPMFCTERERAVLLCPALLGVFGVAGIVGFCLPFGVSPFCFVFARGLVIELDVALNVLQDHQQSPCTDRSDVLHEVVLPLPLDRAHWQQVHCGGITGLVAEFAFGLWNKLDKFSW